MHDARFLLSLQIAARRVVAVNVCQECSVSNTFFCAVRSAVTREMAGLV